MQVQKTKREKSPKRLARSQALPGNEERGAGFQPARKHGRLKTGPTSCWPLILAAGRACRAVRSQAEPGNEERGAGFQPARK